MALQPLPTPGTSVWIARTTRRPVEYIVVDHKCPLSGMFRAARPSRKHPGDYFGAIHVFSVSEVVPNPRPCSVRGCADIHYGKDYCRKHYRRVQATGQTETAKPWRRFAGTLDERIAAQLERQGDCLVFTGSTDGGGYGHIRMGGTYYKTHIRACENAHGPKPRPDHEVLHSCDNPPCCEPTHLRWGTHYENVQDAVRRDRLAVINGRGRGEGNPRSKLTEAQVLECRTRNARGAAAAALAREFGMSECGMRHALSGKNWSHLPLAGECA